MDQRFVRRLPAASKAVLAQRIHATGESASIIADTTLGVKPATVYRVLAEQSDGGTCKMTDDTGPAPESDAETAAGPTEAADVGGAFAWSGETSSQPVVDYNEPWWHRLWSPKYGSRWPKVLASAAAVAIGAVAVAMFTSEHQQPPAPSPLPSRQVTPTPQAAPTAAPTVPCGVNNSADEVYDVVDKFKRANPSWVPGSPIGGNFDPCATLSTVIMTKGNGASANKVALMFHKGKYVGYDPKGNSYDFISLNAGATTDTTVVLNFRATQASCNACTDAVETPVRFRWMPDYHVVAMLDIPPDLYKEPDAPHDVEYQ